MTSYRDICNYLNSGLSYLQSLPTLNKSQFEDLKIEENNYRVWLSRMAVADGAPYNNQVIVEWYNGHDWVKVREYEAR